MAIRKKTAKQDQSARQIVPTPKRDPSGELYPSPYSDDEWRHLDVADTMTDLLRATRKSEAAKQQIEGGRKLFVDPDLSDHSATATVLTHRSMVETLAEWGKQADLGRSQGGGTRAQQRKDAARKDAIAIRNAATILRASHAPREIPGILMQRGFGGRDKILRALRGDPSTAEHWPPRKKDRAS